jgi:hypothetical protein
LVQTGNSLTGRTRALERDLVFTIPSIIEGQSVRGTYQYEGRTTTGTINLYLNPNCNRWDGALHHPLDNPTLISGYRRVSDTSAAQTPLVPELPPPASPTPTSVGTRENDTYGGDT